MICIVAPYSPISHSRTPNLGAARKLESLISVLSTVDDHIVLVNSAHNDTIKNDFLERKITINGVEVYEILLPTYSSRTFGKLLNIFHVNSAIRRVISRGHPKMTWLYNGYTFENLFAIVSRYFYSSSIVLEFEDWHFARSRGFSLKPWLDWVSWHFSMKYVKHAFCVNTALLKKTESYGVKSNLLPGLISDDIAKIFYSRPPFNGRLDSFVVGYFGGLSVEKGCGLLLEILPKLPPNVRMLVTGSGSLSEEFLKLKKIRPDVIDYESNVSTERLIERYEVCDVILNPHMTTKDFMEGVFPSKVVEAVGTGRMVISTALPSLDNDYLTNGIIFSGFNADEFLEKINNAREIYISNAPKIAAARAYAIESFGVESIRRIVKNII